MPMLRKHLMPVHVFNLIKHDDVYVGTEMVPEFSRTVNANVQPAERKVIAEAYGERVYNMLSVIATISAEIDEKNELSFGAGQETQPTHKVVSVKRYTDHCVILAEKVM